MILSGFRDTNEEKGYWIIQRKQQQQKAEWIKKPKRYGNTGKKETKTLKIKVQ